MKNKLNAIIALLIVLLAGACGPAEQKSSTNSSGAGRPQIAIPSDLPAFNADSAYYFTQKQVEFGPRVPNTPEHVACGDYLIETLRRLGFEVIVQSAGVTAYTGETLRMRNIIGRINPEVKRRIMLAAHWDTRPFSDQDAEKPNERFDGAIDGASGVGILLEIARVVKNKTLPVGLDIVFFDAEDYGNARVQNSYCLGSQYFATHPPYEGFKPAYGILLDMPGAQNATFFREGYSMQYAPQVVNRVWTIGRQLGYGAHFVNENSGAIIDDHYYINSMMNIPMIDIIHHDRFSNSGFGDFWHTQRDNMSRVDKTSLMAVGHTLLGVIYSEQSDTPGAENQ